MLTTTIFGFKKSQTTDPSSALRTAPNDNADILEAKLPRRSAKVTATAEFINSASGTWSWMTTPDRIDGIVLPANAKIRLSYQAEWRATDNAGTGAAASASFIPEAAVFIGANQLKAANVSDASAGSNVNKAPQIVQLDMPGTNAQKFGYRPLASSPGGLVTTAAYLSGVSAVEDYTGDVTTGQLIGLRDKTTGTFSGSVMEFFVAAGTYDIGVKFNCSNQAGTDRVYARNRKLWIEALIF